MAAVHGWPDHKPVEREAAPVPIADQARYAGTFTIEGPGDASPIRRDGDRLVAEIWKGVIDPPYPALGPGVLHHLAAAEHRFRLAAGS
ncbi:hypothetical protein ACRAWD_20150 [Caulobacter segnis]